VNLQLILLNHRARPDASHEFVLGDEFTGRLNQSRKDLERTVPQRNGDSLGPQFTPPEIYLPSVKFVHYLSAVFMHAH
jgi:hypothetical protein